MATAQIGTLVTFTRREDIITSDVNDNFDDIKTAFNNLLTSDTILSVGDNNIAYGSLYLYGHATGSTAGGRIRLYNAADHDGSIDYFHIFSSSDDLWFAAQSTNVLVYSGGNADWRCQTEFGTSDGGTSKPGFFFRSDNDTGIYRVTTDTMALVAGGVVSAQVDDDATAGNTRLLVYDVDNGTLERVTVGAADSGGTNYKVLRIPN